MAAAITNAKKKDVMCYADGGRDAAEPLTTVFIRIKRMQIELVYACADEASRRDTWKGKLTPTRTCEDRRDKF